MQNQDDRSLMSALEDAIKRQDGKILEIDEDGQLRVETADGLCLSINLDRMRQLIANGEETVESAIVRFLGAQDRIWKAMADPKAQVSGLRTVLEHVSVLDDGEGGEKDGLIYCQISEQLISVLEWMDPEETSLVMLTAGLMEDWSVTPEQAIDIARANMDDLLKKSEIMLVDGGEEEFTIAELDLDSCLTASLVMAPGFKEHVIEKLGWPIMAIAPCRDRLCLFPADHRAHELAGLIAESVVNEYNDSAYPLSLEFIKISDEGYELTASLQPT